jgi:hypothetical protein
VLVNGWDDALAETRKLAAILAADVVGYSRLAGTDEVGANGCDGSRIIGPARTQNRRGH